MLLSWHALEQNPRVELDAQLLTEDSSHEDEAPHTVSHVFVFVQLYP